MKFFGFRFLTGALWFFSEFSCDSQHCSCRNGRGKKVTGKKHGLSHGNGWRKTKGSQDDEELLPKLILKERNPWLTPIGSCAVDEREEHEEKPSPYGPHLACRIPIDEDVKRRDSRHGSC